MKVKNNSNQELKVVGIGIIKPGQVVEVPENFHNSNFTKAIAVVKEKVEKEKESKVETKL